MAAPVSNLFNFSNIVILCQNNANAASAAVGTTTAAATAKSVEALAGSNRLAHIVYAVVININMGRDVVCCDSEAG